MGLVTLKLTYGQPAKYKHLRLFCSFLVDNYEMHSLTLFYVHN